MVFEWNDNKLDFVNAVNGFQVRVGGYVSCDFDMYIYISHTQFEHDKRVGGLASQMSDTVRHVIHTGHFRIIVVINIV